VSAGDISVAAEGGETATTFSIGVGIGGDAGLAGAATVYSVADTTTASIGAGATVFADDKVAVLANDASDLHFVSGGAAGSGRVAVGASAGVAVIVNTT
jgi:hypothetical protein